MNRRSNPCRAPGRLFLTRYSAFSASAVGLANGSGGALCEFQSGQEHKLPTKTSYLYLEHVVR